MKRLMEISRCTECRHLKIKDGFNTHYYECAALKHRSSDIHSTSNQGSVHTELNAWFANCTVWTTAEKSCATCKHWDSSSFTEHNPVVRECLRIREYKDCYKSDEDNYEPFRLKDTERETLAFTFDHDMYASGIYTRAEFLCNMYEQKDLK